MKFLRFAIYIYIYIYISYLYISYVIVTKVTNHNGLVSLELNDFFLLLCDFASIALPLCVFHILFSSMCSFTFWIFVYGMTEPATGIGWWVVIHRLKIVARNKKNKIFQTEMGLADVLVFTPSTCLLLV